MRAHSNAMTRRNDHSHYPARSSLPLVKVPSPLLPRWLRLSAVAVVAGIIFYGSLVTVPETVIDDAQPDLIQISHWRHVVAYATLAYTIAYATDHWQLPRFKHTILIIALAAAYGILMELGQQFLPHRSPFLVTDVLVNTLGASLVSLWFLIRPHLAIQPVTEHVGVGS